MKGPPAGGDAGGPGEQLGMLRDNNTLGYAEFPTYGRARAKFLRTVQA